MQSVCIWAESGVHLGADSAQGETVASSTFWLVVSDLHCGSVYSLMPPNFVCGDGQVIGQSPVKKWAWKQWAGIPKWVKSVTKGKRLNVIVNGDLIEGDHHESKEIWSPATSDHVRAAIQTLDVLRPIAKAWFIVDGTECHDGDAGKAAAAHFRTRLLRTFKRKERGILMTVLHHFPTAGNEAARSGAYSKEIENHRSCDTKQEREATRVLIGAHRHSFGCFDEGYLLCLTTPAWQAFTRYASKVVRAENIVVGAVILEFRADKQLPIVHKYLRPLSGKWRRDR